MENRSWNGLPKNQELRREGREGAWTVISLEGDLGGLDSFTDIRDRCRNLLQCAAVAYSIRLIPGRVTPPRNRNESKEFRDLGRDGQTLPCHEQTFARRFLDQRLRRERPPGRIPRTHRDTDRPMGDQRIRIPSGLSVGRPPTCSNYGRRDLNPGDSSSTRVRFNKMLLWSRRQHRDILCRRSLRTEGFCRSRLEREAEIHPIFLQPNTKLEGRLADGVAHSALGVACDDRIRLQGEGEETLGTLCTGVLRRVHQTAFHPSDSSRKRCRHIDSSSRLSAFRVTSSNKLSTHSTHIFMVSACYTRSIDTYSITRYSRYTYISVLSLCKLLSHVIIFSLSAHPCCL